MGILGGTFDPVHNAHLALARAALERLALDRILWIPTGNPHYRRPAVASAQDRLAMLELALAGEPRFAIDERELAPTASGYTVDTLRALRRELGPQAELYLLIGSDQYGKLGEWRAADELARLARVAVFERPGYKIADRAVLRVPMPPMPDAASDIRAHGARQSVPPAVANYIERKGLYR